MFTNTLHSIKTSLSPFCKTFDSFDSLNMQEHLNEMLCFVGITNYKTGEVCVGINGNRYFAVKLSVCVDILADRTMTASQLAAVADSAFVKTLSNIGLDLISVERKNCEFSKAHSRYKTSVTLELEDKLSLPSITSSSVLLNGALEPSLQTYQIINSIKTASTPLVSKGVLSNSVCQMPTKIILGGFLPFAEADSVYSRYMALSNTRVPINIGANTFTNMVLTNINLAKKSDSVCSVSLEFTEVNE